MRTMARQYPDICLHCLGRSAEISSYLWSSSSSVSTAKWAAIVLGCSVALSCWRPVDQPVADDCIPAADKSYAVVSLAVAMA